MEENRTETPLTFAVDLEKTEYLHFFRLLYRFDGGQRIQSFILGGFSLFLLLMLVAGLREDGLQAFRDADFLLLCGIMLLDLAQWLLVMPLRRRQLAKRTYTQAVEDGQIFAGTVTVTDTDIVKETPSGTQTIRFTDRILYLETPEMQVFVNTGGRSIVLPARCLTPADAAAVREKARAALPPPFFRVLGTVVPQRQERMPVPEAPVAPETLFSTRVTYRDEERHTLVRELSRRAFLAGFLPYVPVAFLLALVFGLMDGFVIGAVIFWSTLLLLFLLVFSSSRRRYAGLLADDAFSFLFSVTADAITAESRDNGKTRIRWSRIAHAVEGEDAVEFYNRRQYMYIPKRCIDDIEDFRRLVERCRSTERNG